MGRKLSLRYSPLLLVALLAAMLLVQVPSASATSSDTHFLVLGAVGCTTTAIATDADCWSHTSGGAGGVGVPGVANTARLDANSGAAASMDAAMNVATWDSTGFTGTVTTNGFALTAATGAIKISGTLNAGSSVITAHGDFNVDSSAGTFNQGTSTVVMAASGSIYPTFTFYTTGSPNFYKLTINSGVTATIRQDDVRIIEGGQLTVNGVLTSVSPVAVALRVGSTQANPLVIGPSGDISTLVGVNPPGLIFRACEDGTYTINLPSTLYPEVRIANGKDGWNIPGCAGGTNVHATFSMLGPISTMGSGTHLLAIASSYGSIGVGSLTVKTNGFALTTGILSVSAGGYLDLSSPAVPTDFRFSTNTGSMIPVSWTKYAPHQTPGSINPAMAWRFTIGSPGAAVTMLLRGMLASTSYDLKRDGNVIATASSDSSGILTYTVTGGWSTNDMEISGTVAPRTGGGNPPPAPVPTPTTPLSGFSFLGLQFHDGYVIGPGLIAVLFTVLAGVVLSVTRKALIILAAVELAIVFIVSLFLYQTNEYLVIVVLWTAAIIFIGRLFSIAFWKQIVLAMVGAGLMGLMILLGVHIGL